MKAVCWYGSRDVRVRSVAEPTLVDPTDALVRVTSTAICGSDLHLYNGFVPTMRRGDILGHEFMGEVVEVGAAVERLSPGDRVVVPFPISCGHCWFCKRQEYSLCDNSNPNAWMAEQVFGHAPAGIYGYSHLMGGYPGGQAELVRVPFADVGPIQVGAELSDDRVLLLSDVLPTAWMAAENCEIQPGDIVAVWGCGPVGTLAIRCARLLGAERVIAIDRVDARLALARQSGAETLDLRTEDILDSLRDLTGGRGPDACIDAVGLEAHGKGFLQAYDRAAQAIRFETDRPAALREAIYACRKGGVVSLAGAYAGFVDKIPMGAAFNKALRLRMGQTHVQRYLRPLLERVRAGELDPSDVISHHLPLADAPHAYDLFCNKEDECTKVVLKP